MLAVQSPIDYDVVIPALPLDIDAFVSARDRIALTPHGGAAMFVLALVAYAQDPRGAEAFLTVMLRSDLLDDDREGYRNKRPRRARRLDFESRIAGHPEIARSYVQGTSAADGYALKAGPWVVRVRVTAQSVEGETRAKVFVWSTGADSARPITVERNANGVWKAAEWSSLEVGVRGAAKGSEGEL